MSTVYLTDEEMANEPVQAPTGGGIKPTQPALPDGSPMNKYNPKLWNQFRVTPEQQQARDRKSLGIIQDELRQDSTNNALIKNAAYAQGRVNQGPFKDLIKPEGFTLPGVVGKMPQKGGEVQYLSDEEMNKQSPDQTFQPTLKETGENILGDVWGGLREHQPPRQAWHETMGPPESLGDHASISSLPDQDLSKPYFGSPKPFGAKKVPTDKKHGDIGSIPAAFDAFAGIAGMLAHGQLYTGARMYGAFTGMDPKLSAQTAEEWTADAIPDAFMTPFRKLMQDSGYGDVYDKSQVSRVMNALSVAIEDGGEGVEKASGGAIPKEDVMNLANLLMGWLGVRGSRAAHRKELKSRGLPEREYFRKPPPGPPGERIEPTFGPTPPDEPGGGGGAPIEETAVNPVDMAKEHVKERYERNLQGTAVKDFRRSATREARIAFPDDESYNAYLSEYNKLDKAEKAARAAEAKKAAVVPPPPAQPTVPLEATQAANLAAVVPPPPPVKVKPRIKLKAAKIDPLPDNPTVEQVAEHAKNIKDNDLPDNIAMGTLGAALGLGAYLAQDENDNSMGPAIGAMFLPAAAKKMERAKLLKEKGFNKHQIWADPQARVVEVAPGMWVQELSDHMMKFLANIHRLKTDMSFRLGDVVEHPELYNLRPDMEDVRIAAHNKPNEGVYYEADDLIRVPGSNADKANLRLTGHEIQHALEPKFDMVEGSGKGMPRGGSAEEFLTDADKKAIKQAYNPATAKHMKSLYFEGEALKAAKSVIRALDNGVVESGMAELKKLNPLEYRKTVEILRKMIKADDIQAVARDKYWRLTGEVLAREVAKRLHMTPLERAAKAPEFSVAMKDVITRYETGSGKTSGLMGERPLVGPDGKKISKTELGLAAAAIAAGGWAFLDEEQAKNIGVGGLMAVGALRGANNRGMWHPKVAEIISTPMARNITRHIDLWESGKRFGEASQIHATKLPHYKWAENAVNKWLNKDALTEGDPLKDIPLPEGMTWGEAMETIAKNKPASMYQKFDIMSDENFDKVAAYNRGANVERVSPKFDTVDEVRDWLRENKKGGRFEGVPPERTIWDIENSGHDYTTPVGLARNAIRGYMSHLGDHLNEKYGFQPLNVRDWLEQKATPEILQRLKETYGNPHTTLPSIIAESPDFLKYIANHERKVIEKLSKVGLVEAMKDVAAADERIRVAQEKALKEESAQSALEQDGFPTVKHYPGQSLPERPFFVNKADSIRMFKTITLPEETVDISWKDLTKPVALTPEQTKTVRKMGHEDAQAWNLRNLQSGNTRRYHGDMYVALDSKGKIIKNNFVEEPATGGTPEEAWLNGQMSKEGNALGTCAGTYCVSVLEGVNKFYSLRDSKGRTYATVRLAPEVMPVGPVVAPISGRKLMVAELKGPGNGPLLREYHKYGQDLIRNGDWAEVNINDLKNTGLIEINEVLNALEHIIDRADNQSGRIPWKQKQVHLGPLEAEAARMHPKYLTFDEANQLYEKAGNVVKEHLKDPGWGGWSGGKQIGKTDVELVAAVAAGGVAATAFLAMDPGEQKDVLLDLGLAGVAAALAYRTPAFIERMKAVTSRVNIAKAQKAADALAYKNYQVSALEIPQSSMFLAETHAQLEGMRESAKGDIRVLKSDMARNQMLTEQAIENGVFLFEPGDIVQDKRTGRIFRVDNRFVRFPTGAKEHPRLVDMFKVYVGATDGPAVQTHRLLKERHPGQAFVSEEELIKAQNDSGQYQAKDQGWQRMLDNDRLMRGPLGYPDGAMYEVTNVVKETARREGLDDYHSDEQPADITHNEFNLLDRPSARPHPPVQAGGKPSPEGPPGPLGREPGGPPPDTPWDGPDGSQGKSSVELLAALATGGISVGAFLLADPEKRKAILEGMGLAGLALTMKSDAFRFKGAAFRDSFSGKVHKTGPIHNRAALSEEARRLPAGQLEAGFIGSDGKFYTRDEAIKYIQNTDNSQLVRPVTAGQLHAGDMGFEPGQEGKIDKSLFRMMQAAAGGAAIGGLVAQGEDKTWGAIVGAGGGLLALGMIRGKRFIRDMDELLGSSSTRIGNIDANVKLRARELERNTFGGIKFGTDTLEPLLDGVKDLKGQLKEDVNQALMRGDFGEVRRLLAHDPDMLRSLTHTEQLINVFRSLGQGKFSGMVLKNYDGLLEHLGPTLGPKLSKHILDTERNFMRRHHRNMNNEELSHAVNNYLLTVAPSASLPPPLRVRTPRALVDYLEQFYESPSKSLVAYVHSGVDDVQTIKFFGKDAVTRPAPGGKQILDLEASINKLIDRGLRTKQYTPEQGAELKQILQARFKEGMHGSSPWLQHAKNAANAGLLGNIISAMTQGGDVFVSAAIQGWGNTLAAAMEGAVGKSRISPYDMGLANHISEEFSSQVKSAKALQALYKGTGFAAIDMFGKRVTLNAALRKYEGWSHTTKGQARIAEKYQKAFKAEYPDLLKDLQAGNLTERVKALLFSELSDVQPVSRFEMPQKYLEMPNGRVIYMLKTFMLKQMDIVRRDGFQEYAKGNRLRALGNMVRYGVALGVGGATTDMIKDFVQLKPFDAKWEDIPLNMIKKFGWSKYTLDKARSGRPGAAVAGMIAPPYGMMDDIIRRDRKAMNYIPGLGKWYEGMTHEEAKAQAAYERRMKPRQKENR